MTSPGARITVDNVLAKAKEADENAAKSKDNKTRNSWNRIADEYRELA
jgi:hypothetical protein